MSMSWAIADKCHCIIIIAGTLLGCIVIVFVVVYIFCFFFFFFSLPFVRLIEPKRKHMTNSTSSLHKHTYHSHSFSAVLLSYCFYASNKNTNIKEKEKITFFSGLIFMFVFFLSIQFAVKVGIICRKILGGKLINTHALCAPKTKDLGNELADLLWLFVIFSYVFFF